MEELSQGAKIRVDPVNGGYVVTSTAWGVTGAGETNVVVLVKLDTSLQIEWSKVGLFLFELISQCVPDRGLWG